MEAVKEKQNGRVARQKLLVTMALPITISMLVQALYNVVDQHICQPIQRKCVCCGVAGVSGADALIIAVAVGTGVGMNSLVSRRLGEKKYDDASEGRFRRYFPQDRQLDQFAAFGIFFSQMFFEAFTAGIEGSVEIAAMGTQYVSICTVFPSAYY